MLTFTSKYQGKFCNFYFHLSLETAFPGLKLTQIFSINVKTSFLENWKFNPGSSSPTHIPSRKDYPLNLTKYEKGKLKIPIFQSFSELGGI